MAVMERGAGQPRASPGFYGVTIITRYPAHLAPWPQAGESGMAPAVITWAAPFHYALSTLTISYSHFPIHTLAFNTSPRVQPKYHLDCPLDSPSQHFELVRPSGLLSQSEIPYVLANSISLYKLQTGFILTSHQVCGPAYSLPNWWNHPTYRPNPSIDLDLD